MNIIAFAGSNSKTSINKKLVTYAADLLDLNVKIIDFNDCDIPLYSINIEKENGFSNGVENLFDIIKKADIILVSFAEHNASFTAELKSNMDWCSRINPKFLEDKKIFAMSTSPGGYGGKNALDAGVSLFKKFGGEVLETFSLPKFNDNFSDNQITNEEFDLELKNKIEKFKAEILE